MSKASTTEAQLRQHAEKVVNAKLALTRKRARTLALKKSQEVIHELQVHQLELEMQNEELRRVQAELDAARERYFDLYDLAPVAYCTLNEVGLILEANFKAAKLLGTASKMLLGQPMSRYVPRSDQNIYYKFKNQLKAIGQHHSCELWMASQEGFQFWAHLEASAHGDKPGERFLRVTISDISQLKLAEEGLAIAAASFEANAGKVVTDAQGVILKVNKAFTEITGYSASEALGKTPRLLKSGRHDQAFYEALWNQITVTGQWRGEIWNQRKSGEIYPEWLDISAVKDKTGLTTHYIGSFNDVSETVSLRYSGAASRERLLALFNGALNSILLADDEGRYIDANPAACSLLGYARAKLLKMKVSDILVQTVGWPESMGPRQKFIEERRLTRRAVMRHCDGHLIAVEYAAVASIQPGVHLSVLSDVSAHVDAFAALQDARQHLRAFSLRQQEEFDQLRGDLARDLHDQLGQTLSALKLEIDMLASENPIAAQRMYPLVREAVNSVRDVSRALRPIALELGLVSALQALAAELSMRSDVDIKVNFTKNLPALSVQTELCLYRIAQEALTNAANHAGASNIELSLSLEPDQLVLEVADDGQGFLPTDASAKGGLGLIGMRERAILIGAELLLESAPGKGTRIKLKLAEPVFRSNS